MKIHQEKVWAGTEASYKSALEAEEWVNQRLAAGGVADQQQGDLPRLLTIEDGVATVSIKGSLNNDADPWNGYFGMTGYPEIRDALVVAANDPEVKQILLEVDSGGGAVSGVADTAKLIRTINDNVKPVTTFSDGTMASAAYWLGASAGKVYAGNTAVVGSIGVLSTHREYSQALKEAGVGVTVIRAGKYKALANSVEPLSEAGKQQIQQVVDAAYGVFVGHVAAMRGKSYDYADQTMAQGREFVGQAAADVSLVDGITTFDKVVGDLKAKVIDASNNFMDNRGKPGNGLRGQSGTIVSEESDMGKKALTEQEIAAIAAGAAAVTAQTGTATAEPASVGDVTESEGGEASTDSTSVEAAATTTAEPAVSAQVDASSATIQLLTAQLKEKDDQIIQAHVKIARMEEDAGKAAATQSPLLDIAMASVNNMRVALNMPKVEGKSMDALQVVAEHGRLAEQFAAQYKVGGIAAVSANQSVKNEPAVMDALTQARLAAVRFSKK